MRPERKLDVPERIETLVPGGRHRQYGVAAAAVGQPTATTERAAAAAEPAANHRGRLAEVRRRATIGPDDRGRRRVRRDRPVPPVR